uniref:Formin-like protein 3 n=1 Tax=Adineta vaga TaxID=104782 RepID=B3G4L3_ADIVA|nr:formin-like protein 3 [Adineta vaga]
MMSQISVTIYNLLKKLHKRRKLRFIRHYLRAFPNRFYFVDYYLVSLENIQIDVQDLTRGLDNAKKELVIRQTMKNVETRPLEEFLNIAQAKIDRLIKDAKSAQDSFNQCVEYFGKNETFLNEFNEIFSFVLQGETPRTQNPSNFFSVFVKFQRSYQVRFYRNELHSILLLFFFVFKQARIDNDERIRLAREAALINDKPMNKRSVNKRSQVNFYFG